MPCLDVVANRGDFKVTGVKIYVYSISVIVFKNRIIITLSYTIAKKSILVEFIQKYSARSIMRVAFCRSFHWTRKVAVLIFDNLTRFWYCYC